MNEKDKTIWTTVGVTSAIFLIIALIGFNIASDEKIFDLEKQIEMDKFHGMTIQEAEEYTYKESLRKSDDYNLEHYSIVAILMFALTSGFGIMFWGMNSGNRKEVHYEREVGIEVEQQPRVKNKKK